MAKILVNVAHGPEHPTGAAQGFLVARAAAEEGHDVSLFLAGDVAEPAMPAKLVELTFEAERSSPTRKGQQWRS